MPANEWIRAIRPLFWEKCHKNEGGLIWRFQLSPDTAFGRSYTILASRLKSLAGHLKNLGVEAGFGAN
jgi:hypothetical protein